MSRPVQEKSFNPALGARGDILSKAMEGKYGDVALMLYVAPFILNFAYALYLWFGAGISAVLPQYVFLEVAQSPYLFLAGFAAVSLAAVIDFNSEVPEAKKNALVALSKRLQSVAVAAIALAFVSSWYSASLDVGTAFLNLLDGRYPLVFPALLVLLSFLILPSVKLQGADRKNLLEIVLLLASPAALYEIGKRNTLAGLGVGLILLLAAAFILIRDEKKQ
jgi:hypothetical protein